MTFAGIRSGLAALAVAMFASFGSALAAPDDAKPPREKSFIDLIDASRAKYNAARRVDGRTGARLGLQIALHDFLGLNHYAKDWLGVYKGGISTPEGFLSIAVEIAPGVVLQTWDSLYDDAKLHTMIRPYDRLAPVVKALTIGDPVKFSGDLIGSRVSNDADMVLRPRLITHFDQLERLN
jgi:hypothetical protein